MGQDRPRHALATHAIATHALATHALATHALATHALATLALATMALATMALATHAIATHALATHAIATHTIATHAIATHAIATLDMHRTTHLLMELTRYRRHIIFNCTLVRIALFEIRFNKYPPGLYNDFFKLFQNFRKCIFIVGTHVCTFFRKLIDNRRIR